MWRVIKYIAIIKTESNFVKYPADKKDWPIQ